MTIEHTIAIEASPDTVWAVTTDVGRWPEWTPTVSAVRRLDSGPLGVGSETRVAQPGQPAAVWTVSEVVPGRRFVWQTARAGLRMRATHEVTPEGAGTRNVLCVELSGVLARLLSPLLRPLVRRALAAENRGLKARCEAGDPQPGRPRRSA